MATLPLPVPLIAAALLVLLLCGIWGWRRWRTRRRRHRDALLASAQRDLQSDRLQARLMAISNLENVASGGGQAYWEVARILSGYLRERSRREPDPRPAEATETIPTLPADFQMALTVLARYRPRAANGERSLDLSGSHLSRAGLPGARLAGANLRGCWLIEAELWKADLENADLSGAHLDRANLSGAVLDRALLCDVSLKGADLEYASLREADLSRADLEGANLSLAHLEHASLAAASGLTRQQLESAFKDADTDLPKHMGQDDDGRR